MRKRCGGCWTRDIRPSCSGLKRLLRRSGSGWSSRWKQKRREADELPKGGKWKYSLQENIPLRRNIMQVNTRKVVIALLFVSLVYVSGALWAADASDPLM